MSTAGYIYDIIMYMTIALKIILSLLIAAGAGFGGYKYVTRPAPAPSVSIEDQQNTTVDTNTKTGTNVKTDISTETDVSVNVSPINLKITSGSTAQFKLNEVLRSIPTVVIGATNSVSGDVNITFSPANITVGEVKINARTLKTDNEQRNGAIARMILHSDKAENEFIVFNKITITGLPETIEQGKNFTFKASGNLTANGVTKPVVFNGQGIVNANNSFTGSATTTITYGNWGISVPSLAFLANVDKDVQLTLNFLAK